MEYIIALAALLTVIAGVSIPILQNSEAKVKNVEALSHGKAVLEYLRNGLDVAINGRIGESKTYSLHVRKGVSLNLSMRSQELSHGYLLTLNCTVIRNGNPVGWMTSSILSSREYSMDSFSIGEGIWELTIRRCGNSTSISVNVCESSKKVEVIVGD